MTYTTHFQHLLWGSIGIISSAALAYTIGVWGERLQRQLKRRHVVFFGIGFLCDITGTALMGVIAQRYDLHNTAHALTGTIAVMLMLIHLLWAIYTLAYGNDQSKRTFSRFSVFVWGIWMLAFLSGMVLGMMR